MVIKGQSVQDTHLATKTDQNLTKNIKNVITQNLFNNHIIMTWIYYYYLACEQEIN